MSDEKIVRALLAALFLQKQATDQNAWRHKTLVKHAVALADALLEELAQ